MYIDIHMCSYMYICVLNIFVTAKLNIYSTHVDQVLSAPGRLSLKFQMNIMQRHEKGL